MKNYGNEERVYTFTMLKYNIKAMGVSGEFCVGCHSSLFAFCNERNKWMFSE